MAQTKTPLLSLGSHGTIGNALTTQKRGKVTMVRTKPTPAYRHTLPQVYQRWLYEDYAYLWKQQTAATQQTYASTGSRYHLTGFQYWMKYNLTNLPDIAGLWTLDSDTGSRARDLSRNANHGTIIGATPVTGPIHRALYFDGINDEIRISSSLSLRNFTKLTIEFFAHLPPFTGTARYLLDHGYWNAPYGILIDTPTSTNTINFRLRNTLGDYIVTNISFTPDTWTHFAVTWDGSTIRVYSNGILIWTQPGLTGTISPTSRITIGNYIWAGYPHKGTIDHLIIYNRNLNITQLLKHSRRRYPS